MKKAAWTVALATILLTVVLVALIASQAQNAGRDSKTNTSITVEGSNYPLKLTMTLNKTQLNLGEALEITLNLENVGNETLALYFSDGNDRFEFAICNESDTCVYSLPSFYPQDHVVEYMRSGDLRNMTHLWDQEDGLVYQENNAYYNKVPPGIYHIKGSFVSNTLEFIIETPFVTFKIVE